MPPRQFGQCLEHGIEHTGRDPSSITSEHAVPLAILIRQMSPLRAGPRDPHHAFKIGTIILRRAASTTSSSGTGGEGGVEQVCGWERGVVCGKIYTLNILPVYRPFET